MPAITTDTIKLTKHYTVCIICCLSIIQYVLFVEKALYSMYYLLTKHYTVCIICWQSILPYILFVDKALYSMYYLLTKHYIVCIICWQSIIQYVLFVNKTLYSMDYLLTKHFTVCFICWQSIIQYSMYYFACRDFPRLSVIGQPCSDILYSRIRNKNLKMKKWKFLYTLAQFYISKTTHAKVYCNIVVNVLTCESF